MRIFEDDDSGYLALIDGHQHGFVVNTTRKPDPGYLFLHRASYSTIRGKTARRRDGKDESSVGPPGTPGLSRSASLQSSFAERPRLIQRILDQMVRVGYFRVDAGG